MEHWFGDKYGSKRGFLKTQWHRLVYRFGGHNLYHHIDWSSVDRLVFICKGNICRSAFAETVARDLGMDAISAGTHTNEGAPADSVAIKTAQALGYDLSKHLSTPVEYANFRKTDLLITMEPWQAELVKYSLARRYATTLLGLWSRPVQPYIFDPYGSSAVSFQHCFQYITKSVYEIVEKIQKSN